MNIKGIALALLLGASLATGARAAQSLNPLGGVIIGTPGSGQSLQNYTFSCSVSGCATGSVEPALELTQAGAFLSVTNGLYSNLLQGNAVLSATHGLFTNLLQGDAVIASGNPLFITGTGTAGAAATGVQTVQGIASMTPLLVNPGTATSWGVLAQASTTSGELGGLSMGAVTTASPTYTTAQTSPLSLDTTGALRVNVTAGGGSGGTSAADASTWTAGTTAQTVIGCEFTTSGATALVTAHMGTVGCTAARGLFTDKSSVAGTALTAAVSAYGTAPTGTAVEGVNAFITNTNANGSATSANSSPVVIASDQIAVAVKAASAAFASGSIASGALASGSISSGAAVSGAFATGAIADLAVAQGATTSGKVGNMGLAAVTTAAPTYTTGQLDPLSLDTAGSLRINCTTGCSASTSITSWGGGTLGAMANFGTTPTAVLVPGMNASLFIGTTAASAGHGTAATALRVELPTDGTGVVGLNAGSALIGKVGIDQTTVGTTNAVSVAQIGATTVLTGTGAVGTGAQRIAVGTDTATIAGSSPASAGFVATGSAPPTGSQYLSVLEGAATTGGKATAPINCDNHVFKHITTATDTNAVTGVTGQAIYICSWRSRAAGVATWFLETSANTSGTCGTPTQISGVATEAANTGETWGSNFWSGLKSAAANGVCINSTGTGGVDVDIWYTQL